jgi:hypothetical protein
LENTDSEKPGLTTQDQDSLDTWRKGLLWYANVLSILDRDVSGRGVDIQIGIDGKRYHDAKKDEKDKKAIDASEKHLENFAEILKKNPQHKLAAILNNQKEIWKILFKKYGRDCKFDTLNALLTKAVEKSINIGLEKEDAEYGAGSIYLHDWRHDELVMAASYGFQPHTIDESNKTDENIKRLGYLQETLCKRVQNSRTARHPWLGNTLRSFRYIDSNIPDNIKKLNCNELLIGVAYYESGSDGITRQLFDKESGENLERLYFDKKLEKDDGPYIIGLKFKEAIETEFGTRKLNKSFFNYIYKELFSKRTIIFYDRTEDMGESRQFRLGRYVGLQFLDPELNGPSLATVLRFNNEHFGVLKIERYKKDKKDELKSSCFKVEQTVDFLIFAYVLAGTLYILKHYLDVDLSTGWNVRDEDE